MISFPPVNYYRFVLSHSKDILSVTALGIEIALMGLLISWGQLRYAQRRDKKVDERNAWEKVHKAMIDFRLRRELLNSGVGKMQSDLILDALIALHQLRGQLNRLDSPLAIDIENYLQDNWKAEQWREDAFVPKFDELAQEAARRSR